MGSRGILLLTAVAAVFVMGLLMVFNTSSAEVLDLDLNRSTHQALFRQLCFCALGCLGACVAYYIGYRNVLRMGLPLLILVTFLLVLVFVPGIGMIKNGARRWLGIGGASFQPSEMAKLVIPIYFIQYILEQGKQALDWKRFLKVMLCVSVPLFLILIEPDNGTTGIIGLTLLALFVLTRIRFRYWAWPMLGLILVGLVAAVNVPYVYGRIQVYLHPETDLQGRGHQPYQAKIAAGSGQVFGRGLGQSIQKLNYLPEAQNDYIAAIYAEETGFVGVLTLLAIYMVMALLGFSIANDAVDRGGLYLAAGLTFLLCIQAFLNLGVVSGLLPSKGLNLPFFSQGGTSLIGNIIGVGLLLSVEKEASRLRCMRSQ